MRSFNPAAVENVPAGTIIPYGSETPPSGYLLCNGQAVSRTTYADLFLVVSTAFGAGDGATTFNVPDLRGRVPLCKDDLGGVAANRVTATEADNIGQGSGAQNHTITTAEMPVHTHTASTASAGAHTHNISTNNNTTALNDRVQGLADSDGGSPQSFATDSQGAHTHTVTVNNAGSGNAHNNMSPYQTVAYMIKT